MKQKSLRMVHIDYIDSYVSNYLRLGHIPDPVIYNELKRYPWVSEFVMKHNQTFQRIVNDSKW